MPNTQIVTGNYFNKHESKNKIYRFLVKGYKNTLLALVADLPINSLLEIGSGEGYILSYIRQQKPEIQMIGSDIDYSLISSSENFQSFSRIVTSGESISFKAQSFDCVVACEVLEHVPHPEKVLDELYRVTRQYVLISVPREPEWRLLNMLRLKYLRQLGNTPGHINHWSKKQILALVEKYFCVLHVKTAFPWTFILAVKDVSKSNP